MAEKLYIDKIPAILWGEPSKKICIYIHGQGGNKKEAEYFSKKVCKYGWQVISIDLPDMAKEYMKKISLILGI